ESTCDAALMLLVLAYLNDPAAALAEAARVIRPGGRLVVVDLLEHDREDFRRQTGQRAMGFAPETLAEQLTDAGLTPGPVKPIAPEPEARGPALLLAVGNRPA
ncbi:MAG: methyltransferase domain-containing protein, partial [Phycisphaeraceae bacterium]|nr:methyltransferase domain-containing protein [Phycisphaeraceae bacterium]